MAAAAVGICNGLGWEEIAEGLATVAPLPGRTRLLEGISGARILDDSYNASPESAWRLWKQ
jgi:UDP-N-acetylmuramoyl-tripeptide--D-alanyl-D-alanine ligase